MKLEPLPRALQSTLISTATAAALVAVFGFEFSIPTLGVSGIGVALAPRWSLVVLERVPDDVLWAYHGDEWGNGLTHLRHMVAHDFLLVLSTLSFISLATRHVAPARIVPPFSALACMAALGLAAWNERRPAVVQEWALNVDLSATTLLTALGLRWAYSRYWYRSARRAS